MEIPKPLSEEDARANYLEATGEKAKKAADQACAVLLFVKQNVVQFFRDQYGNHYAVVQVNSHRETLPLDDDGRFGMWVRLLWRIENGGILASNILKTVCEMLVAEAEFSENRCELHVRLAGDNNRIWYDLANKENLAVRLTADGWTVEDSPMFFRRYSHQQPQPMPRRDYAANAFDQFFTLTNVKSQDDRLVLKCYIIALFYPGIEQVIHLVHGEQGSAKSTLHYLIKRLVDPSSVKKLLFPHDQKEFVQLLSHHYVVYFDQVSKIPQWLSDYLCAAATGTGFSKRRLYTDDDDVVYDYIRPVGLNGINLLSDAAPDLLDRSIIHHLERIPKENRRKNREIEAEFEKLRPQLLGYIFDALSRALKLKEEGAKVENLPRTADFAEIAEIISQATGERPGRFLSALYKNIQVQIDEAIEASPVALAVRNFMEGRDNWEGRFGDLLNELGDVADGLKVRDAPGWPKSPQKLSQRLNVAKTNLREIGIMLDVRTDSKNNTRIVSLSKIPVEEKEDAAKHARDAPDAPGHQSRLELVESTTIDEKNGENSTNVT